MQRKREEIEKSLAYLRTPGNSTDTIKVCQLNYLLEVSLDIRDILSTLVEQGKPKVKNVSEDLCKHCGGKGHVFGDYKEVEEGGKKKLVPTRVPCPSCQTKE